MRNQIPIMFAQSIYKKISYYKFQTVEKLGGKN